LPKRLLAGIFPAAGNAFFAPESGIGGKSGIGGIRAV
jgi:hypothetical protein